MKRNYSCFVQIGNPVLKMLSLSILLIFVSIFLPQSAHSAQVTLAWNPNTEGDLAGYRLYFGVASRTYKNSINVGKVTQYTITNLDPYKTYYYALTAYDTSGNESPYSSEVVHIISNNQNPNTPQAPSGTASGFVSTTYTLTTSGPDPNNDTLEFRFDWGDGVISEWGSVSQTHSWFSTGTYYVKAQSRDSHGAMTGWSGNHKLTISHSTHMITASTGRGGSISPSGSAVVNSGSRLSFTITPNSNYSIASVVVDGMSAGALSSYTFNNVTANHTIRAIFGRKNQPPVANSGMDQAVYVNDTIHLDGSQSNDPDGDMLAYHWSFVSVPQRANAVFNNDSVKNPAFVVYVPGTYIMELIVNDGSIGSFPDTVIITVEQQQEGFNIPEKPYLLSPYYGQNDTSLTPTLVMDQFNDRGHDIVHAKTQWQIFRVDDGSCVLDISSSLSLTSLKVPKLILEANTSYVWKARFMDDQGNVSQWSDDAVFITGSEDTDANGDGTPDHQEVQTSLDLDQNGMDDQKQNDIKCIVVDRNETQMGILINDDSNILAITAFESEDPNNIDSIKNALAESMRLPFGLIHFRLLTNNPGDEVVVTVHISEAADENGQWYKYDPVNDEWTDYSDYIEFSRDRKTAYLSLKDGGFGDMDGVKNSIIVDPIAFGINNDMGNYQNRFSIASKTDSGITGKADSGITDTADSGSGKGGCFIHSLVHPSCNRQQAEKISHIKGSKFWFLFMLGFVFIGKKVLRNLENNKKT